MKAFQQIRQRFLADARRYLFAALAMTGMTPALAVVRVSDVRRALATGSHSRRCAS